MALTDDKVDETLRSVQSQVSKTISSIEVAIADWEALDKKPPEYEQRIASLRRALGALQAWELRSLKNSTAAAEKKREELKDFVSIAKSL